MEFHEKLQELRKCRGLTQEELAEALYVSRTAISKWESGRGYPSIDSLKAIATYFSVSIDDLLSGEKLLSIAEKENKSYLRKMCALLFGMVDMCAFLLIVLPLYPSTTDGYIYSVNLLAYAETTTLNRAVFWILFVAHIIWGLIEIGQAQNKTERRFFGTTELSMVLNILTVIYLALAREAYAIVVAFLLLVLKGIIMIKCIKTGNR